MLWTLKFFYIAWFRLTWCDQTPTACFQLHHSVIYSVKLSHLFNGSLCNSWYMCLSQSWPNTNYTFYNEFDIFFFNLGGSSKNQLIWVNLTFGSHSPLLLKGLILHGGNRGNCLRAWVQACPLVITLVPLKCYSRNLQSPHRVPLYQGENALVPLPFQQQKIQACCRLIHYTAGTHFHCHWPMMYYVTGSYFHCQWPYYVLCSW